jgi:hypothetical protein
MEINLPTILAGPILRRCSKEDINIWLATSQELFGVTIKLFVTKSNKSIVKYNLVMTNTHIESVQAGKRLWFCMVTVRPVSRFFPVGQILAYEIGGVDIDYSKFSINPYNLPTLIIRNTKLKQPANILYGSCRKLHGPGKDATEYTLKVLEKRSTQINKRPSSLFLTGDQIYADDVSSLLIEHLSKLGYQLIGKYEEIGGIKPNELSINGREDIITGKGKFTSSEAKNHLMTFGEYASMYLIAWNPDLWPKKYPINNKNIKEKYDSDHASSLNNAKKGSSYIRKLLANIPTYMIFDDHEITDDWNLTTKWKKDVEESSIGKQVIINGLVAFWGFQAWGNEPSRFSLLKSYLGNKEKLLQFHEWAFVAPTYPKALFINTRTRRSKEEDDKFPLLLDKNEIEFSKSQLNQYIDSNNHEPIIVVIPTPLYGFYPSTIITDHPILPKDKADHETFKVNPCSFNNMLRLLHSFKPDFVIILSGDVHYGFVAAGSSSLEKNGLVNHIDFVQFTSSATKNQPLPILWISMLFLMILGYISTLYNLANVIFFPIKANKHYSNKENGVLIEASGFVPFDKNESIGGVNKYLKLDNNFGFLNFVETKNDTRIYHKFITKSHNKIYRIKRDKIEKNWPVKLEKDGFVHYDFGVVSFTDQALDKVISLLPQLMKNNDVVNIGALVIFGIKFLFSLTSVILKNNNCGDDTIKKKIKDSEFLESQEDNALIIENFLKYMKIIS